MKNNTLRNSILSGVLFLSAITPFTLIHAADAVVSPVQAKADPFGLAIAGKVDVGGSDAAAAEFMKALPSLLGLIKSKLPEAVSLKNASAMTLDPSKLRLTTDAAVRVYFAYEGAGYHNTLGVNTLPPGSAIPTASTPEVSKNAELVFADASSTVSSYEPAPFAKRTASDPLLPGDFTDLGVFKGGTLLDFFLIANGAGGGSSVYTAEAARNDDRIQHMATLSLPGSPYWLISYEDLQGGGDRDFNDVIFAVDMTSVTLQKLVSAPEPKTWGIMAGFLGLIVVQSRRKSAAAATLG